MDKVERWRYDKLLHAGYTESQALMLAIRREIDLHQAVALRAKTDLAFAIIH